jgi:hypothetical protein
LKSAVVTSLQASANDCALRRDEGFFAGARVIGVVGFASPSESYHGRLQRNPHVTNLPLSRSDRAWGGLVMEQPDSALNIRATGTDARLNFRSNLDPLAINLARAGTCLARRCRKRVAATPSVRMQRLRILVSFPRKRMIAPLTVWVLQKV